MSDPQMLGFANGIANNLSAIAQNLATAFVGNAHGGTFTMSATASKTVTDASVKAASYIILIDTNAAAATLQGSAKRLYPTAANGSFTVATANATSAVGTETFLYLAVSIG